MNQAKVAILETSEICTSLYWDKRVSETDLNTNTEKLGEVFKRFRHDPPILEQRKSRMEVAAKSLIQFNYLIPLLIRQAFGFFQRFRPSRRAVQTDPTFVWENVEAAFYKQEVPLKKG